MSYISDLGINQAIETFQNRVGSPLFGSVTLSFVSINWKALFYLFFDEGRSVHQRISKFDQLTSWETLGLYPIIIGAALALFIPWMNWAVRWAIHYPVARSRMLNERISAKRMAEKGRLSRHVEGKIKSPSDVNRRLNQDVLGAIPQYKKNLKIVKKIMNPQSGISEAYASTTAMIEQIDGLPKVIHLTSTHSGEGKSTSALALAKTMFGNGKRVLLMDADLRLPVFDYENSSSASIGLVGLINGTEPISKNIITTPAGFDLLPAGRNAINPSQMLSHERFDVIIKELSEDYDYLIIDGPPILYLADATIIGKKVKQIKGITILLVKSELSVKRGLRTIKLLDQGGADLQGVILTHFKPSSSDQYGGYIMYSSYSYVSNKSGKFRYEGRKRRKIDLFK